MDRGAWRAILHGVTKESDMTEQVNNKDLLYSTGNYIHYLVINYNGKELKKYRYIHIYVELNHFSVHLKLTQYCKSNILQFKERKKQ